MDYDGIGKGWEALLKLGKLGFIIAIVLIVVALAAGVWIGSLF